MEAFSALLALYEGNTPVTGDGTLWKDLQKMTPHFKPPDDI